MAENNCCQDIVQGSSSSEYFVQDMLFSDLVYT